jgi:hypothetical protein
MERLQRSKLTLQFDECRVELIYKPKLARRFVLNSKSANSLKKINLILQEEEEKK